MNNKDLISPTDLLAYAKANGWVPLLEAQKDRLHVMTHPSFERRQLVFPMDTTAPDFAESIERAVAKLADIEKRGTEAVPKRMIESLSTKTK